MANLLGKSSESMYIGERPFWPGFPTWGRQSSQFALNLTRSQGVLIVVRDLRMWHAGMPNYTKNPRVMPGFIYGPQWFGSCMGMTLPASTRDILA